MSVHTTPSVEASARRLFPNPHVHDTSAEGGRAVSVSEFLNKIESVLANMGLP